MTSELRGRSLALVKCHSILDNYKKIHVLSESIVNDWNELSEECINATSINMFKNRIDQYFLKTRCE